MSDDIEQGGEAPATPPVPAGMTTEMWPIERVRRYWRNPRRKQNVEKIANSIQLYGWRQPLVVDGEGIIIVGDTRYLGAVHLGQTHVPVWVARDLDEKKVTAYRLADNRIAEESEWDEDSLTAELQLLQELGVTDTNELEELTGFDEDELAKYMGGEDDEHTLEPVDVQQFPPFTWVLIGVPTQRYHEIAETIEAIAAEQDFFCEVAINDEKP